MDERVDELMEERRGTVTIHPSVLVTIARLSAVSVPRVCRMSGRALGRILGAGTTGEGTRVVVEDHAVTVDLYVIVDSGASMLEVGRAVQGGVTRAIQEMVGMPVRKVNVHIDDVQLPCPPSSLQEP